MASPNATLPSAGESRIAHWLAVVLACATFPMVCVGAMVTTTKAGMAVPDWPRTYGYNPVAYPWTTWLWGPWNLFIEHGHRLLGWIVVGPVTILLMLAIYFSETRRWVRWAGLFALMLVVAQGVLGGMRVRFDATELAKIHGCIGPLFFVTTVALCEFTSRRWRQAAAPRTDALAGKLQRLALITTLLVYAQLIAGAQLRHMQVNARPQTFNMAVAVHLFLALAVFVHAALLTVLVTRHYRGQREFVRPALVLAALVVGQLLLGLATWKLKYGWPSSLLGSRPHFAEWTLEAGSILQSVVVTAHVAVGSLILAVSLVLSLRSLRWLKRPATVALFGFSAVGAMR